ncbi:MAG TPA: thiamine pyrophosphate-binding protein [Candidatus Binatia bacterium]|jgi:acetolactate synthase-1/2/3 large subunit|nr:thiamine pyrophosphate-binding protein [Candidatus Binatia bacterium]
MIETEGLTGADTLLRVLAHMGVDRIFSSRGSEWSPVWEAFAKAKAQSEGVPLYLSSRHEEVAVGMASDYTKSTGKLPAVMIHTTVGALHATMALRGALHEQIPMVVFTGESLGFGEETGPDVGAQWLGALADIGGPARLVDQMELRYQCEIALAVDDSTRLSTGDGHAQGSGLRFHPDGVSIR